MSVSDLRYESRASLNRIVVACEMTDVVFACDERGHFIESFAAPAWFMAMPPSPTGRPVAVPKPKLSAKGPGICRSIYDWTVAHPDATVDQAIAQFPDANKGTVNSQFHLARRFN